MALARHERCHCRYYDFAISAIGAALRPVNQPRCTRQPLVKHVHSARVVIAPCEACAASRSRSPALFCKLMTPRHLPCSASRAGRFMFDFRQFLFRSPERDGETDRRRLALLQQSVHSALADAEYESNGLRGRLEKARQSAAFLLEQMEDGVPEMARQVEL